jgi:hypothetical protein
MNVQDLKDQALTALELHFHFMRRMDEFDADHQDVITFSIKNFGTILKNLPRVLISEDELFIRNTMFEYYILLHELKMNIQINYPYGKLFNEPILNLLNKYPCTYHDELKDWFEKEHQIHVGETKQTLKF